MAVVLSALALLQAQAAPPAAADLANRHWQTMSTAQLAARLLPAELARSVVGHKADPPITADGPPTAITFVGKPRPSLDGFCERRSYHVPVSAGSAMVQGTDLRLGACPDAPDAEFAHVNPQATIAESKGALRWLFNARTAARGTEALPFEVACTAEASPDLCAGNARAALADLPVENAFIVDGRFHCQPGESEFAIRQSPAVASPVWRVRLVRADKQPPRLQLTWTVPPPF